jgi:glycosyltransferase involved in cell wall biosynthesis
MDHVKLASAPRVLIDVTPTYRDDRKTGIQRAVREIAKASIASGSAIPVIIENGRLLSYFRHPDLPDTVEIRTDDRLLLLDMIWEFPREYLPIFQEVARRGGKNIWLVHDIIVFLYPGVFLSGTGEILRRWFEMSLPYYDAVVAVSRTVAEDFSKYVSTEKLPHKPSLRGGWYTPGADFAAENKGLASPQVIDLGGRSFFLTVGTVEPRKNHITALAAFEQLWKSGVEVCYVIVGKSGWLVNALRTRIQEHAEFGRRLFWFDNCDDTDLQYLYRHATAVIQPSIAEGFGLPIVEAAHFGTPVIASNIRIFREVGGESISYFDPMDAEALAKRLTEALDSPRVAPSIATLSWTEAAERLINLVKEEAYEFTLPTS